MSDYAINANELRNHSYLEQGNVSKIHKNIDTYKLASMDYPINGSPSGMVFYSASPSRGAFVTVIGVSNDKVLVAGTQYDANYQQLRDNGKELDVSTLYDKYNNSDYEEIAKQIVFAGSQRSLNTDSDESSSTEKVTRANVIDKVEDYEGHQLDTETYTYKEPEQDENGDWGFSILDKNGDLVGSYIVTSDGIVTKYDEHGDQLINKSNS